MCVCESNYYRGVLQSERMAQLDAVTPPPVAVGDVAAESMLNL